MISDKLEKLRPKIRSLDAIPTVPAIVQPLTAMLQQPADEIEMERVIELVSYDKTITAQCLRMANSPLFGRRQTDTVRSAVMALGLKRVQAVLMSCCMNMVVPAEKWVFDPVTFWRHSLGCALVSRKMAQSIGYPDPEKAYLAGLLHDLGILVNSLVCGEDFRKCIQAASDEHVALHRVEEQQLGFTHCESGKILADQWHLPLEVAEVVEFHHRVVPSAGPLVSLVYLSDLLCRVRDLGYGYYEVMGIDLAGDAAWAALVQHYPQLANVDLARFTMDLDAAIGEIAALVDAVFTTRK
jgi:putative nucleotidyltransferase with HDIG domain